MGTGKGGRSPARSRGRAVAWSRGRRRRRRWRLPRQPGPGSRHHGIGYDRRVPWRALLEGEARDRAREVVEAIAAELDRRAPEAPGLGNGQAGIAILHGYRARAGCADGGDRAFAALEHALANLATAPSPWLFEGTAGIGFAIHHLAGEVGEASDVLAQIDRLVLQVLSHDVLPSWDLTDGCVGLGVYGLERGVPPIVQRAVAPRIGFAERDRVL